MHADSTSKESHAPTNNSAPGLPDVQHAHSIVKLWKERQRPMSVESLMAGAQLAVLEWLMGGRTDVPCDGRFDRSLKIMSREVGGIWPRPAELAVPLVSRCPCAAALTAEDIKRNVRDYNGGLCCEDCADVMVETALDNAQAEEAARQFADESGDGYGDPRVDDPRNYRDEPPLRIGVEDEF